MVCGHCVLTLHLTVNETLNCLSPLPVLMQESFSRFRSPSRVRCYSCDVCRTQLIPLCFTSKLSSRYAPHYRCVSSAKATISFAVISLSKPANGDVLMFMLVVHSQRDEPDVNVSLLVEQLVKKYSVDLEQPLRQDKVHDLYALADTWVTSRNILPEYTPQLGKLQH